MNKRFFLLLVVFLLVGVGSASAALDNAEVYYASDSGSGNTLVDVSGNGNNGTLRTDVSWSTTANAKLGDSGIVHTGYAGDTGVQIPANNYFTDSWSVGLWIKPDSLNPSSVFEYLFYNARTTDNGYDDFNFNIRYGQNNNGEISVLGTKDVTNNDYRINLANAITTTSDYSHVMVVWNNSNKKIQIYINGDFETEATWTNGINSFDFPINLGGNVKTGAGVYIFNGLMDEVSIYHYALNSTQVSELVNYPTGFNPYANTAPVFTSYNISNSAPVRTNDVVDVNFVIQDDGEAVNVTSGWYKSTDNSTWTAHVSDNQTFTNVSRGVTVNTGSVGDLEPEDTNAFEYWKATLNATSSGGSTVVNTTSVYIDNDPAEIVAVTSGTNYTDTVNKGDSLNFNITGTDVEEQTITAKVCSGLSENWTTCTVLAQDLTGQTWSASSNTTLSIPYTTTETTRNNTVKIIIYDGGNYTNTTVDYFVNQFPVIQNFSQVDTTNDTTFYFNEIMDYFDVEVTDAYDGSASPTITVTDPEGTIKVNNQSMMLTTGNTYRYSTNTLLDAVGTWNVSVTNTDSEGATTTESSTFTVLSTDVSQLGTVYAYNTGFYNNESNNYTNWSTLINDYGYYAIEVEINQTTLDSNWAEFKEEIALLKNDSDRIVITLQTDLTGESSLTSSIQATYSDLIGGDYLQAVTILKIDPLGATNNTANTGFINNISKVMFQETNNNFPIYVKDYEHTSINTNYVREDIYSYVTATNKTAFIDAEMNLLRTTSSKSRFYNNLSSDLKDYARTWQDTIISQLRSDINSSTDYTQGYIGELNNYDIVVANNLSTEQTVTIPYKARINGKDAYDLTDKKILATDVTANYTVTLPAQTAHVVYYTDLLKLVYNDLNVINLFGQGTTNYPVNTTYGGSASNAFKFGSSSANPDDGRFFYTDPAFNHQDFYVWYGQNGFEAIADFTRYDHVIIGDDTNSTWITDISTDSGTSLYGYVSVNTYGNNNEPDGCTAGVNCTSWNRTKWINDRKADIDAWTAIDTTVDVFIDGLDLGEVNDVDGQFGDALVELSDYVKVTKQRTLILNTYTSYQDYANLGDYTMRESVCGRWDNSVSDPTYSYENLTLEKQRAAFHQAQQLPIMAQTFGAIDDHEKAYYCYMQTKVLYGDMALVSYNQPSFEYTNADNKYVWNYYRYPELGAALESTYTENGDVLTRRFENGIVRVNTTSKDVTWENNIQVSDMQFCGYYYDDDDGASDEGYMRFTVNDNISQAWTVSDDDLTAFQKTWKCVDVDTDLYQETGFYEIEFYYLDSDGTYTGNNGIFLYNGVNDSQDQLSQWDTTLNDHPSNDETDYNSYSRGQNWAFEFYINADQQASIDTVTDQITRTESGSVVKNITFSSDDSWNVPIYDKEVFVNTSTWNGIFVNDTQLNTTYSTACLTSSPVYSNTTVNNETWEACYYDDTDGYTAKVVIPSLSTKTYIVDGNNHPTFDENITGNYSVDVSSVFTLDVNASDVDNDTLTYYDNSSLFNISSTGLINFTADFADIGNYTINITVGDGRDNTSQIINLTVNNDPPTFDEALTTYSVDELDTFTLDVNASDAQNHTITYSDDSSLFTINSSTGLIEYTPALGDNGEYTITITAADQADNSTDTFTLTVNPIPFINATRQADYELIGSYEVVGSNADDVVFSETLIIENSGTASGQAEYTVDFNHSIVASDLQFVSSKNDSSSTYLNLNENFTVAGDGLNETYNDSSTTLLQVNITAAIESSSTYTLDFAGDTGGWDILKINNNTLDPNYNMVNGVEINSSYLVEGVNNFTIGFFCGEDDGQFYFCTQGGQSTLVDMFNIHKFSAGGILDIVSTTSTSATFQSTSMAINETDNVTMQFSIADGVYINETRSQTASSFSSEVQTNQSTNSTYGVVLPSDNVLIKIAAPDSYVEGSAEIDKYNYALDAWQSSSITLFEFDNNSDSVTDYIGYYNDEVLGTPLYRITATREETAGGSSGGGGGGGGGSGISDDLDLDDGKKQCSLSYSPSTIQVTNDKRVEEVFILNRDSVTYSPDIEIVAGEDVPAGLSNRLSVTNAFSSILPDARQSFGVQITLLSGDNFTGIHEYEAVLTSNNCKDFVIPIQYVASGIPEQDVAQLVLEGALIDIIREPVVSSDNQDLRDSTGKYFNLGALFLIVLVLFFALLSDQVAAAIKERSVLKTSGWVFFALFVSVMVTVILLILLRLWL